MSGVTRTWVNWLPLAVLAVMTAGFVALGVAEARADAPTFDEPVYVSAGLAAVLHHDVTLNDEHPPLPKVLAVLPVLFTHPVVPANGRWSGNDEESYGARFVAAELAAGKLGSVTFASRLVPAGGDSGRRVRAVRRRERAIRPGRRRPGRTSVARLASCSRHRSPGRHRRPVRLRGVAELVGARALAATAR